MSPRRRVLALIAFQQIVLVIAVALTIFLTVIKYIKVRSHDDYRVQHRRYRLKSRIPDQVRNMYRLVGFSDETCLRNLRMDRNAFGRLCYLLEQSGGVKSTKNVSVPEQVAMLLSVLAHHKKNCVVKHDFIRSGRTVSKHFHAVLHAICKLHKMFLAKPTPISDDCSDPRCKWFKVLLTSALPGNYYLCDNGYANSEGFLTLYRGVRYHLREWDRGAGGAQNKEELFNYIHSSARNVIERTFGLLKSGGEYFVASLSTL
ncbi:UNVERIFIED_CONTAM: hypothetical protein Sradi_2023900 [Sesamum radiatum]|uniref:DDE Tnp4 domain-containing protein n=1 Tax=Sesamum radiatum TaxID=300843 RepID=A0AAW2TJS4_SESRA